jgi:hypothetical protein
MKMHFGLLLIILTIIASFLLYNRAIAAANTAEIGESAGLSIFQISVFFDIQGTKCDIF